MLYSFNKETPVRNLPFRLQMPDGTVRTDPETFTAEELELAGWAVVEDVPEHNPDAEKVEWNPDTMSWDVSTMTDEELDAMYQERHHLLLLDIRSIRDARINDCAWRVQRYESEIRQGLEPTDDIEIIDAYMQSLRDITNSHDLNNIVWPESPWSD